MQQDTFRLQLPRAGRFLICAGFSSRRQEIFGLKQPTVSSCGVATARFSVTERPRQPVLIVSSRLDRLVHHQCSINLARAWDIPFIEHSSAGHDLPLDDPAWLSNHIGNWMKTLPNG
jgi:predicted alpha/beta hydrolase family esterase